MIKYKLLKMKLDCLFHQTIVKLKKIFKNYQIKNILLKDQWLISKHIVHLVRNQKLRIKNI